MSLGKILHMDVIADATAIWSGVISTKYLHVRAMPKSNAEYSRDQMSLYPVMFTKLFGSSCRVEVTKGHIFDPVNSIEPPQDLFEHQFRLSIWVNRVLRCLFVDWYSFRNTVRGTRRGKDESFRSCFNRRMQQVQSAVNIIMKIFVWILHGLANERLCGEMHNRLWRRRADCGKDRFRIA